MTKTLLAGLLGFLASSAVFAEAGKLTQWSTIDALLLGHFQGEATLAEVKRHGDFGLGTFDALHGELVLLDGEMYRVDGCGKVGRPSDSETTPFAAATTFRADITLELPAGLDLAQTQARIDAALPSRNVFYAVKISGKFAEIRTRSVAAQQEPYPTLAEVVKTQALFTLNETEGTLVGLWCPSYVKGLNVPGYHFHYLNKERTGGGHLLGLVTGEGLRVEVSVLREFTAKLPDSKGYDALDLSKDQSKTLHAVESERK